ncbi:uncharacterized protein LOC132729501, partial [Ruditapes philippinarum]|uniref:uncharacterized protein LOC132729501 n=1 Tax=Ruditapes philippinarum TaxID=129788 RepID=UPI00295A9D81
AIAVKWKHIKPSAGNESLSGYVLEYKQKGSDSTDACSVALVSTKKSFKIQVEQNVLVDSKEFVVDGDKSVIEVNDLIPETRYQVILEFRGINNNCRQYKMQTFVTVEAKCVEGCIIQPLNESYIYESYLRMIPLPNDNYLVTWQYYKQFTNQSAFNYVIRVLGEPFLNQLSANLVPNGNRYSLLTQLNRSKTYTINLQVFSSSHGGRPLASQYLLVMPMSGKNLLIFKDILRLSLGKILLSQTLLKSSKIFPNMANLNK